MLKKIVLLFLAIVLIGLFFHFNLHQLLTLEGLKGSMDQFTELRVHSPVLVIGGFFVLYVLVTALALPGAAILTLAAGALFGLFEGLVIASFASSIGALCSFLVSRYLLRDSLKKRFPERLTAIDEGIKKEGAF